MWACVWWSKYKNSVYCAQHISTQVRLRVLSMTRSRGHLLWKRDGPEILNHSVDLSHGDQQQLRKKWYFYFKNYTWIILLRAVVKLGDKALFTPGPLNCSLTVKQAMLRDLGSRDVEFINTVKEIRSTLLGVAGMYCKNLLQLIKNKFLRNFFAHAL